MSHAAWSPLLSELDALHRHLLEHQRLSWQGASAERFAERLETGAQEVDSIRRALRGAVQSLAAAEASRG